MADFEREPKEKIKGSDIQAMLNQKKAEFQNMVQQNLAICTKLRDEGFRFSQEKEMQYNQAMDAIEILLLITIPGWCGELELDVPLNDKELMTAYELKKRYEELLTVAQESFDSLTTA